MVSWRKQNLLPFYRLLSEFLHNSNLSSAYSITTALPTTGWGTKVYHSESTTTMEQCAALCQLNELPGFTCNMFSWDGTTCYIGNHEKITSSNINPPAGDIYITPCTLIKYYFTHLLALCKYLLSQPRFPQK